MMIPDQSFVMTCESVQKLGAFLWYECLLPYPHLAKVCENLAPTFLIPVYDTHQIWRKSEHVFGSYAYMTLTSISSTPGVTELMHWSQPIADGLQRWVRQPQQTMEISLLLLPPFLASLGQYLFFVSILTLRKFGEFRVDFSYIFSRTPRVGD